MTLASSRDRLGLPPPPVFLALLVVADADAAAVDAADDDDDDEALAADDDFFDLDDDALVFDVWATLPPPLLPLVVDACDAIESDIGNDIAPAPPAPAGYA